MGKVLLVLVAVLVLALAGFAVGVSSWLKRYLKSDELLAQVAWVLADRLETESRIAPLQWTGYRSVYTDSVELLGAKGAWFERIATEGLRMDVSLDGFWGGTVQMKKLLLDRLDLRITAARPGASANSGNEHHDPVGEGIFSAIAPKKFSWDKAEILNFSLYQEKKDAVLSIDGSHLKVRPRDSGGLEMRGRGGRLRLPSGEEFEIRSVSLSVSGAGVYLNDYSIESEKFGALAGSGEILFRGGGMSFDHRVVDMDVEKVLHATFADSIKGRLKGELSSQVSPGGGVVHEGSLQMVAGVLERMAVLDEIARHTRTDRFRRLALDSVSASFRQDRDRLEVEDIVIRSEGLIRIEGDLDVIGDALAGSFRVGVAPSTLRWIPGAERKIFTEEKDGLVWTGMQVGGTRQAPEEDLSARLRSAAIVATLEEVPGKAIGFAAETTGKVGGAAVEAVDAVGGGAVKTAGDVAADALGVVGGVLGALGGEPSGTTGVRPENPESGREEEPAEQSDEGTGEVRQSNEATGTGKKAGLFLPFFR